MDDAHGLTTDQIARLASMVDGWTPAVDVVARSSYRVDSPDVVLDLHVRNKSSIMIPVRVRFARVWLDRIPAAELEPHVHRILTIVSNRNLETDANNHDELSRD